MSELKPKQKPCKRHRAHPEFIYNECIGCEIEGYSNDLDVLKGDLAESDKQNKALYEELEDARERLGEQDIEIKKLRAINAAI